MLYRYFFTHDNVEEQVHPLCPKEMETIRRRTMRDVLCDNMKDSVPMFVKNPFLTPSDDNPLEICNPISNMRVDDLCLFGGEGPTGITRKAKTGTVSILRWLQLP